MMMDHNFPPPPTLDTAAIDAKFWAAHAAWRAAEDACAANPDHPDAAALVDRASELRDTMFCSGVFSATALLAKLDAINEGMGGSCLDMVLPSGHRVMESILWDCGRIAMRENGGNLTAQRHSEADYKSVALAGDKGQGVT